MNKHLERLVLRFPNLESCKKEIESAFDIMADSFSKNGKLLIAGNGGSASDSEHIAGELMKNFIIKRKLPDSFISELNKNDSEISQYLASNLQPGLPAVSLCAHTSLSTACNNDIDGNISFAQQILVYAKENDVFLGITTSGNAKNVIYAAATAKAKKIKTIVLTGIDGGKINQFADICIKVPETETYKIQELHLPVYHALCLMLEERFFGKQ